MRVGITVFGGSADFPVDEFIEEYKQFVENNSKIRLQLVVNKYPALSDNEIIYYPGNKCYFVEYVNLSDATKSKFPSDVDVRIMLWYIKDKPVCFGGGTRGDGIPNVSIPFGYYPDQPCGPWKHGYSQIIFHEWMHGLDIVLNTLGFPGFPSSDECGKYGFNGTDDPCWQNCYKFMLSLLTDDMYIALGESITTTSQNIASIAVIGAVGALSAWTVLQNRVGAGRSVYGNGVKG